MLSTLVGAVKEAGLVDSLNSAPALTVFAPANSAFAKIPQDTLNGVLADKEALTEVLTYHVVPGRLSPDQLAGTHKTLEGEELTVAGSGTDFTVDGTSAVVCGNVRDRQRDRLHRRHRAHAEGGLTARHVTGSVASMRRGP